MKKLSADKKGVFGLTAVQSFFGIILGIALLAYVIVIVIGSLGDATILTQGSGTATNETGGTLKSAGYTLTQSSLGGFTNPTITALVNSTSGLTIQLANVTTPVNGIIYNNTAIEWEAVGVTYTYDYDTTQQKDLQSILSNTSEGITSFFGAISPVYAILAILVIILVLTVLVRVVQGNDKSMDNTPAL